MNKDTKLLDGAKEEIMLTNDTASTAPGEAVLAIESNLKGRIIQQFGNRLSFNEGESRWADKAAQRVLDVFPDELVYTVAAGISPSGVVHVGNLRDIMIANAVGEKLVLAGKSVKFVFSWDDFDRFRKVPKGVDPDWNKYIGMPLSKVPDPTGETESYSRHWQKDFEFALAQMKIDVEYRCQTEEYKSGKYDEMVLKALENRSRIAEIVYGSMSEKAIREKNILRGEYVKNFYPISIYSRFTGKDNTRIVEAEGAKVTYECLDTGKTDEVDITKERIAKLGWKVDWAMRWAQEKVVFEPGGKDHASPGGSYDVSSQISQIVFDRTAPVFVGYEFIGIRGLKGKMSGSSGLAVSPKQLLEIYSPDLLKWLYEKRNPSQAFDMSFDSEIIRQYDEYDRLKKAELADDKQRGLPPLPFRQAISFGQIVQWNAEKLGKILGAADQNYDPISVDHRLRCARSWLTTYNPGDAIKLNESKSPDYICGLDEKLKGKIRDLKLFLEQSGLTVKDIDEKVYDLPKIGLAPDKDLRKTQREFFKVIYNLLIGTETGPRLSTFIYAIDREKVLDLLDV